MTKDIRKRGESIRTFLLATIADSAEPMTAAALGKLGAEKFDVTPRAISTHINNLADQGSIELRLEGRQRVCLLKDLLQLPANFYSRPRCSLKTAAIA